jgi:hypothetical protein
MRGWKILLIVAVFAVLWIILVVTGPTIIKEESPWWDPGIIAFAIGFFLWVMDRYMYKYTPMLIAKGIHTTLCTGDPVATVELPMIPGSTRSNKFYLYKNGGTDWIKKSGGGDKGYTLACSDLVTKVEGDTAHVYVNSTPDLYRRNPNSVYERDINNLPPEFLNILSNYGFNPKNSTVFVAWDPPKVQQDAKEIKELLKYKEMYEEQNRLTQDLRKLLKDSQTIISQQANVHKSSMSAVQDKLDDGQKRPLLRRRQDDQEDEEYDRRR